MAGKDPSPPATDCFEDERLKTLRKACKNCKTWSHGFSFVQNLSKLKDCSADANHESKKNHVQKGTKKMEDGQKKIIRIIRGISRCASPTFSSPLTMARSHSSSAIWRLHLRNQKRETRELSTLWTSLNIVEHHWTTEVFPFVSTNVFTNDCRSSITGVFPTPRTNILVLKGSYTWKSIFWIVLKSAFCCIFLKFIAAVCLKIQVCISWYSNKIVWVFFAPNCLGLSIAFLGSAQRYLDRVHSLITLFGQCPVIFNPLFPVMSELRSCTGKNGYKKTHTYV